MDKQCDVALNVALPTYLPMSHTASILDHQISSNRRDNDDDENDQ